MYHSVRGVFGAECEAELNDVAEALYSYRNFNKATTMTFGYGKEIQS